MNVDDTICINMCLLQMASVGYLTENIHLFDLSKESEKTSLEN